MDWKHRLWDLFDRVLYDPVQWLFGRETTLAKIRSALPASATGTVVDVGAGTGSCASLVPASVPYIWLDIDPAKLDVFRRKYPRHRALLSDATNLALGDRSADVTLCVGISHHLPEPALDQLFQELARITRHSLLFLDAVEASSWRSRMLWRLDRGAHPRPASVLRAAVAASFDIVREEHFAVQHTYVLYVATPKGRDRH